MEQNTIMKKAQCPECQRVFNLEKIDDASEWTYGHDCRRFN